LQFVGAGIVGPLFDGGGDFFDELVGIDAVHDADVGVLEAETESGEGLGSLEKNSLRYLRIGSLAWEARKTRSFHSRLMSSATSDVSAIGKGLAQLALFGFVEAGTWGGLGGVLIDGQGAGASLASNLGLMARGAAI